MSKHVPRLPRQTIVCLSSQPWRDGMWTNKQHIMSRLAAEHRVFHVDFSSTPLFRLARQKLRVNAIRLGPALVLDPIVEQVDGVQVVEFFGPAAGVRRLPAHNPLRVFANFDLRTKLLRRFLAREGIRDAILWIYHPGYGPKALELPHKLAVYDCVDEYSEFPEYKRSPAWLLEREAELCRRADVVFTTSRTLYDRKRGYNAANTYLVHNVGDTAHFAAARREDTRIPDDLATLPKPVIGFVGAVSGYKLSLPWISHLARAHPDWSVALIGPVGVGDPGSNVEALASLPNVHLFGHRKYDRLPAYVKGFDVAVIPYNLNEYTESCFPIKFFEFLATGKPVVVSNLPALADYFDAVYVARSPHEFVEHCEHAIMDPQAGEERRLALAAQNDWPERIRQLMEQIESRLENSRLPPRGTLG